MKRFRADLSFPAVLAGFVAVPVGDPARRCAASVAVGIVDIAMGLAVALAHDRHRDAAILTFLVTLSGVTLAGIGSASWGVVAGVAALVVQQWRSQGVR